MGIDWQPLVELIRGTQLRYAVNTATPVIQVKPDDYFAVANGVWFLLMAPKGTPAPVLAYLQAAAKEAIEDPKFVSAMADKGIDADYRPGNALRTDLWREYKVHTDILRRIGMI